MAMKTTGDNGGKFAPLTRKEFLKLPLEQRRKILKEQAETLIKDCPNYPEEDE